MGHLRMGIPKALVLAIKKSLGARVFVETGTFLGESALWAAKHFDAVHTVEISQHYYDEFLRRPDVPGNTHIYLGDSRARLPEILAKVNSPCVFWLDGHYCGEHTGDPGQPCPVLEEIRLIAAQPDAALLIDDARLFLGPGGITSRSSEWPTFKQVFLELHKHFPEHHITLLDDVIYCVPASVKCVLDKDWLENFARRYPEKKLGFFERLALKFQRAILKLKRILAQNR